MIDCLFRARFTSSRINNQHASTKVPIAKWMKYIPIRDSNENVPQMVWYTGLFGLALIQSWTMFVSGPYIFSSTLQYPITCAYMTTRWLIVSWELLWITGQDSVVEPQEMHSVISNRENKIRFICYLYCYCTDISTLSILCIRFRTSINRMQYSIICHSIDCGADG
jgi:uncharacterized membrane protein (GlpM family)